MRRLAWLGALALGACGGFQNAPLEPADVVPAEAVDAPAPPDTSTADVTAPCPFPVPLELRIDYLPGVRVGEAYVAPLQLTTYPDLALSWWVADGALPAGIVLDPSSGLLHGRVSPAPPQSYPLRFGVAPLGGDACVAAGTSAPKTLKVFGACDDTGPACLPPLTCGAGHCLLVGANCPADAGERVTLGVASKERGVRRYTRARVLANTRDANPAAPLRYARLEIDDTVRGAPFAFSYHLPRDLMLPVGVNHVVTLATYVDDVGSAALSMADAEGQFLFFAYDGPLSGPPFLAVCKSLGACPLQDLANLLSNCEPAPRADGSAAVSSTLKLVAEQRLALAAAGEVATIGDADTDRLAFVGLAHQLVNLPPAGPATPTVWHSFLVQRGRACPTATIRVTSRVLDDGAAELRLDGRASRSLGAPVVAWRWTLTEPAGNGGLLVEETPGDASIVRVIARDAGLYGFALEVEDAHGLESCVSDFVTWWRDEPDAP